MYGKTGCCGLQVAGFSYEYVNLIGWNSSSGSSAEIETGDVALHHD